MTFVAATVKEFDMYCKQSKYITLELTNCVLGKGPENLQWKSDTAYIVVTSSYGFGPLCDESLGYT